MADAVKAAHPAGAKVIKPDTYMNRSGVTVRSLAEKAGFDLKDILIVCDDVNLLFGKMRLREAGGAGGHHGLESVIGEVASEDFARLRIGVGRADMPKDLTGFVLERFTDAEEKALAEIVDGAARVCRAWAEEGYQAALNILSRLQQEVKKEN